MSHWYERAIIYQLQLAQFQDSNGDGIGDFGGAARTLDYLDNLGVDCLWLQPFYVSPRRDAGYDIADYYRIDPRFGSGGDFVNFVDQAEGRGLRVIIDMAFQHTSTRHPWFQSAREDPESPYRDFYLWSDEPLHLPDDENVMGRGKVWTYDEVAGQYYHHSFYDFQPDLNLGNPRLRDEFKKILHFWLQLGVSGFRLDAVPHMVLPKARELSEHELFDLLGELRAFVAEKAPDAVLVGEVDTEPETYAEYFGRDGERLRMLLNFYGPPHAFLAFARGEAEPIRRVLKDLATPPAGACYANFLRNHDELDLERLEDDEREEVRAAFAPDPDMLFVGRGIRRRLAPLLGDDPRRLRLAQSVSFSLPGVPVLYYGDEIAMGDDLSLHERDAVRTPMQWSDEPNAGFSKAPTERLVQPPITGGPFGYEARNVAAGRLDPDSHLNWTMRLIRARRDCPEFGHAQRAEVLDVGCEAVLAHLCRADTGLSLALHNLAGSEVEVRLPDLDAPTPLIELFADGPYDRLEDGVATLRPYGFRWLRCSAFPA